jgi:hypothetical protein
MTVMKRARFEPLANPTAAAMRKYFTMRRLALLITFVAASASAHDFWIEPSTFRPQIGTTFTAGLRVGQDFVGDAVPRSVQLMDSFVVRTKDGERPVIGIENRDPAGYVRLESPGVAIIGYLSKPYPLELAAPKFEEFLRQEGLESIAALRAKRGETSKPDRERFYRFAKAIVGSGDGAPLDRPFGYRYEIVPESNPLTAADLRVRLLFEGKPLAGALVTALNRDDPSARRTARSDAAGRVTLRLPRAGVWLVKSTYMVPAPAGSNVDWESLWASLTFER